jgi:hypothetical protein
VRADIDAAGPSMVGLVRHTGLNPFSMTMSHQVLAFAYEVANDAVTLRIYDPNWPSRDDVTITLELGDASPTIHQSTGESLAGILSLA